jgi:hypothetical protein
MVLLRSVELMLGSERTWVLGEAFKVWMKSARWIMEEIASQYCRRKKIVVGTRIGGGK